MATDPAHPLANLPRRHDCFIGIDSDGCAFDTMELKHKECFIPCTIRHFGLQAVARCARAAAEFVNLYSQWRGINRFPALQLTLELLRTHPDVVACGASVPTLPALADWLEREPHPSNPTRAAALATAAAPAADELRRVLAWSEAVNAAIADMVCGVPPYPRVREALADAAAWADVMVVSATPGEALQREWAEHDLSRYTVAIAGQELGTKSQHLRLATAGRYAAPRVLMVGDAPGDLKAARAVGALFFPILPGRERDSWARLHDEGLARFRAGTFAGDYEAALLCEFAACLPGRPPWAAAGTAACAR